MQLYAFVIHVCRSVWERKEASERENWETNLFVFPKQINHYKAFSSAWCSTGNITPIISIWSPANHPPVSSKHQTRQYATHTHTHILSVLFPLLCTLAAWAVFVSHHHNNCNTEHLKMNFSHSVRLGDGESSSRQLRAGCQCGVCEQRGGLQRGAGGTCVFVIGSGGCDVKFRGHKMRHLGARCTWRCTWWVWKWLLCSVYIVACVQVYCKWHVLSNDVVDCAPCKCVYVCVWCGCYVTTKVEKTLSEGNSNKSSPVKLIEEMIYDQITSSS